MRGLAKGEQSTGTNPVLQLFARQGGYLKDIYDGSFTIDDVRNPDVDPVPRVTSTSINTDEVGLGGHKVGTGRYFIPTGDTSAWAYGTHRAVVKYRMVDGGREYTQEILFEVVNPAMFSSGSLYTGYAATRDLYADDFFVMSEMGPEKLHKHIRRVSKQIEGWTQRFFEPRYVDQRISGDGRPVLFLNEAIVAVGSVGTISQAGVPIEETFGAYQNDAFTVFNRHLDGLMNPDDRDNPKLEAGRDDIAGYMTRGWKWPTGDRNIAVRGVFGFLDPEPESDGVLIGHTPDDFVQIVSVLVGRFLEDPTISSPATWSPGKIKMYKTRDQQIQFYGASGNVSYSGGITGDAMLDQMLLRFLKPARLDYPERRGAFVS